MYLILDGAMYCTICVEKLTRLTKLKVKLENHLNVFSSSICVKVRIKQIIKTHTSTLRKGQRIREPRPR